MAKETVHRPAALADKTASPEARADLAVEQALDRTRRSPEDPRAWLELAQLTIGTDPDQARAAAHKLVQLLPDDYDVRVILGKLESMAEQYGEARKHYERALELKPDDFDMLCQVASLQLQVNKSGEQTLELIDRALAQRPRDIHALYLKTYGLVLAHRYDEAADLLQSRLIPSDQTNAYYWNLLGQIHRDTGALKEAEAAYLKSIQLAEASRNQAAYVDAVSNRLTLMHYMPEHGAQDILQACKEWGALFTPSHAVVRPLPADPNPGRKIRVGLYADGFSAGPVSLMITPSLELLRRFGFEVYLYANNPIYDHVAQRLITAADRHAIVLQLSNEQFAQRIRDDGIDILVDLAGYNTSTRMSAMALEPAPLLVKWVGGLINTTGLPAIDYLITDRVESPLGSDAFYTEKLIRMPDDYICYLPPPSMPDVGPLPAGKNGYVTLGCFNNPTKINEAVLEKWAGIMQLLPDSRLFLKGGAYDSAGLRRRVLDFMQDRGIAAERLRLEGQAKHFELLSCYNDVDVALDPWPYSGGLTTCEALLMGVPVVTLPGPTFAGRHSATHLANAGIPELVAQDWDQYQSCVLALASNLDNLAALRTSLRKILLDSPVCDGPRYARHLATALRAIWQRHCEGKPRASLTFTPEGKPWFEDSDAPMDVVEPSEQAAPPASEDEDFQFQLRGKIVTLDHGGAFVGTNVSRNLSNLGGLVTIAIDPAHTLQGRGQDLWGRLIQHHHHHVALGDGTLATLHLCQDSAYSGTLAPLPASRRLPALREGTNVLGTQTIPTVRLDDLTGLEKVDWLILNGANDNAAILQGAQRLLPDVLIVQAQTLRVEVFEKQADPDDLNRLLAPHGFQLIAQLLRNDAGQHQDVAQDVVFVPDEERIEAMSDDQRWKLAFLLHSAYNMPYLAYRVLKLNDAAIARRYLKSNGLSEPVLTPTELAAMRRPPFGAPRPASGKRRFIHLGYNNIHTQALVKLLAHPSLAEDFDHQLFISRTRSIRDFDIDLSSNPNAWFFNDAKHMDALLRECLSEDVAAVIFHSMFFDWQKQLVRDIGDRQRTLWVMWGSDLYNPIKDGLPLTEVVRHIDAVCTVTDGDYKIFLEHYPARPQFKFNYAQENPYAGIPTPKQKLKRIIVGNSGDPSNCHLEILEVLAKKEDIADYEIVLPLSYNLLAEYEPYIRRQAAELGLEKRVTYLKQFLPMRDYYELIAQAEFVITAHHRQQGLGVLVAAMYFGAKTVLRDTIELNGEMVENPAWHTLSRFSTAPVSFDRFVTNPRLADIPYAEPAALARLQAEIVVANTPDKLSENLRGIFQLIDILTPSRPIEMAARMSDDVPRILGELIAKRNMLEEARLSEITTLALGSHVDGWNFDPRFCSKAFNLCFGCQDLKYAALLYQRHKDMPALKRLVVFYSPIMPAFSLEDDVQNGGEIIARMASVLFQLSNHRDDELLIQMQGRLKALPALGTDSADANGFLPDFLPAYLSHHEKSALNPHKRHHWQDQLQFQPEQQRYLAEFLALTKQQNHQVVFVLPALRPDFKEILGSSDQVFSGLFDMLKKHGHVQILDLYNDKAFKDEYFWGPATLDPAGPGNELVSRRIAALVNSK